MTSDVTAVVLTMGETGTDRAVASLRRQTLPVAEIVLVRDIRPFHRALNEGASKVRTPFFIQVDADMALDDDAVARLRSAMGPSTAITVGRLRDPLLGTVVGIKMFRSQPFLDIAFGDNISPDTTYVDDVARAGWSTDYVGGDASGLERTWDTLGDHSPDYEPAYTYRKHLMEGQRYRHRGAIGGFHGHLQLLESSAHPMALIAQVGLARGFFRQEERDALGLEFGSEEYSKLDVFLNAPLRVSDASVPLPPRVPLRSAFGAYFELGRSLFEAGDGGTFRQILRALDFVHSLTPTWPLKLGLCQGLLAPDPDPGLIARNYAILEPHVIGRFRNVDDDRGGRSLIMEKMFAYALSAGLSRFVLAGPMEGEFERDFTSASGYARTTRTVTVRNDKRGRPRIDLPLALFGHILCPEPKRLDGLAWCLDALRSGYTTAHVPFAPSAKSRDLARLAAQHLFDRAGGTRHLPRGVLRALRGTRPPEAPSRAGPDFMLLSKPRPPAYEIVQGRILMVTQDLGRGGSERQMVAALEGLVQRSMDVSVLSLDRIPAGKPSYEPDIRALGVRIEYADDLMASPGFDLDDANDMSAHGPLPVWLSDRVAPILKAIRRNGPAVLHSWLDAPGIAAGVAGCLMGAPRTIVQQGSMAPFRRGHPASEPMRRAYLALSTNRSVKIVNNCKAGARDNEEWIGLPSGSVGLIYNGFVPASARVPAPDEVKQLRNHLGLPDGTKVVGTAMRFVKEKDPVLWIETAAAIAAARPDVRFLIFGFGPLESVMRERIGSLRLSDRVLAAGPTSDVGLAFSAMDVVLLTSEIEGLPNVMIEAQAVGRPVVAPDVGGTREALREGITGTIAARRTSRSLARAVLGILGDHDALRRVAECGPAFVAERFGLDRMVDDTLRFYDGAD